MARLLTTNGHRLRPSPHSAPPVEPAAHRAAPKAGMRRSSHQAASDTGNIRHQSTQRAAPESNLTAQAPGQGTSGGGLGPLMADLLTPGAGAFQTTPPPGAYRALTRDQRQALERAALAQAATAHPEKVPGQTPLAALEAIHAQAAAALTASPRPDLDAASDQHWAQRVLHEADGLQKALAQEGLAKDTGNIRRPGARVAPESPAGRAGVATTPSPPPAAPAARIKQDLALVAATADTTAKTARDETLRQLAGRDPVSYAADQLAALHHDDAAYQRALARAMPGFRRDYATQQVNRHLNRQDIAGALSVLKGNMDAAATPAQRHAILAAAGQRLTQTFFERHLARSPADPRAASSSRALSQRADRVGAQLLAWGRAAPAEVAETVLDAVRATFPAHLLEGQLFRQKLMDGHDGAHGDTFYRGLSRMVEAADAGGGAKHARETARWLLRDRPHSAALPVTGELLKSRPKSAPGTAISPPSSDGDRSDSSPGALAGEINPRRLARAARTAVGQGDGSRLTAALIDALPAAGKHAITYDAHQRARNQLVTALKTGQQDQARVQARAQYQAFQRAPQKNLRQYFGSLQGQPPFNATVDLQRGAQLRNLAGALLGFQPRNHQAVAADNNNEDWYTGQVNNTAGLSPDEYKASQAQAKQQQRTVRQAAQWIQQLGGAHPRVKVIPTLYAAPLQGVQARPLLQVRGAHGTSHIIDLSAAKVAAAHPDASVPWKYDGLKDFQDRNPLSDQGTLYLRRADVPRGLAHIHAPTPDGVQALKASVTTTRENIDKWGDRIAGVLAAAGSVALLAGSGGTATPLVAGGWAAVGTGMGWGAYRSTEILAQRHEHGQTLSLSDPHARAAWIGLVATAAGGTSLGLSRAAAPVLRAANAANAKSLTAVGNGLSLVLRGAPAVSSAMAAGAVGAGGYLSYEQASALIEHGGQMSPGRRGEAIMFLGLGALDMSAGVRGVSNSRAMIDEPATLWNRPGQVLSTDALRLSQLGDSGQAHYEPVVPLDDEGAGVYYNLDDGQTYFVDSPGAPPVPINAAIGEKLGEGGSKRVYSLGERWVLGIYKFLDNNYPPQPSNALKESGRLERLHSLFDSYQTGYGERYIIADYGPLALEDGSMGIIYPRYPGESPEMSDLDFRSKDLVNDNTLNDLSVIKSVLNKANVTIVDLQFRIAPDGHLVIADPASVMQGRGSQKYNELIIDGFRSEVASVIANR